MNGYCCHVDCATCTGSLINQCTSCTSPLILGTNNMCCHNSCLSCNGKLDNNCLTCPSGRYKTNSNSCLPCDVSCGTCTGFGSSACLTCNTALGYTSNPSNTSTCHICHPCCVSCTIPNDPGACVGGCKAPYISNGIGGCYFKCNPKSYKPVPVSGVSQSCLPCSAKCASCTGGNTNDCTSCIVNHDYINVLSTTIYEDSGFISSQYTTKGFCAPRCASNQFLQADALSCGTCPSNCLRCTSLTQCTSCDSQYQLATIRNPSLKTDCLSWCSTDQYRLDTGLCGNCFAGCKNCQGSSYLDCTGYDCKAGYSKFVILDSSNPNLFGCPKTCIPSNSEYLDTTSGLCQPCHSSCLTCAGELTDNCLTCRPNFDFTRNNASVSIGTCNCNESNRLYKSGNQCLNCHEACQTCTGSQSTHCLVCRTGYKQFRNAQNILTDCRTSCYFENMYYDSSLFKCLSCNPLCKTCNNLNTCLSCPTGKFLNNQTCEEKCPDGKASADGATCVSCTSSRCLICQQNNPSICDSCATGWILRNGMCTDTCPEREYFDNGICKNCPLNCKVCKLETNNMLPVVKCSQCETNMVMVNNNCFTECPPGYEKKVNSNGTFICILINCPPLCEECSSQSKCIKCKKIDPSDSNLGVL